MKSMYLVVGRPEEEAPILIAREGWAGRFYIVQAKRLPLPSRAARPHASSTEANSASQDPRLEQRLQPSS